MAIFRVNKTKDYTVMSNYHLRDKNLSLKATGLLCLMLSLPDTWDFSELGLTKLKTDSRKSIRSAIKELEEAGYLVRTRNRNEKGQLTNTIYDVYEKPMYQKGTIDENPMYQKPMLEKPMLEKEHNKILNNKILNNISTTITTIGEKNIFEIIEENFGRTLNPMEYETIEKWSEYNFPFELLKYAVSKAVLKNIYNISYIDKILYEWDKNNIRTVAQAQKSDEEHEKKKQQPKNNFRHYKTQREREEEAIAKFLSEPDD